MDLSAEISSFEQVIADPSAAIAIRKAHTAALRPRFREVSDLLGKMDRLILRFRTTPAGIHFVNAWQNSRIIRDLGEAAPATPQPTPPPPAEDN